MKAKNKLERQLSTRYIMRYLVKLIIYTVILLAAMAVLYIAANSVAWEADSFIRTHLSGINDSLFTIIAAVWAFGVFVIALMDFNKIAAQFASVGDYLSGIVERPEMAIELPRDFLEMQTVFQKVQNDILTSKKSEQEAIQRKNDLVMYLAHDLRTPLTSISGYLTLLRDEADISEQNRQKYLSVISDKAMRLDHLISDFFEIARFNLDEIILEKSRFDFSRLVCQVADEFKPLLALKGLRVELGAVDKVELFADPGKLERVIDNLLKNAISYSYENTVIHVNITKVEGNVTLQVSNQGPQIPAHKIDRIFEQFYRVDMARSGDTGSAGLGLTIAKAIVERHGGSIAAESAEERTTFTVILPLPAMS